MNWLKSKKVVLTHDGNFHPDDVFSVALLSLLFKGKIKVIRSRDPKFIPPADFVLDTGDTYEPDKNRFDHHQEGNAGFRDNRISFSTFGLLWKKYGEEVCGSKKVADILDKKLVQIIDADDCGVILHKNVFENIYPFLMLDTIYACTPTWKEDNDNIDDYFMRAVDLAKTILEREIKITNDRVDAESFVAEVYKNSKDKRVIIFNDERYFLPKDLLSTYSEPLFTVYKHRVNKMWRIGTIRKDQRTFEVRKNFPQTWWGKRDGDLAAVTGIEDAVFCRNGGIFAGATSKEGAIKMAYLAIEQK
jgi:uncharacterized UPF0160 family protein